MSSAQQQEEEIQGKSVDWQLTRRLLGYVRPYRGTVVLAVIAALLQSVTQLVGPFLNAFVIDRYLDPHPAHAAGLAGRLTGILAARLPANAMPALGEVALLYVLTLAVGFSFDFAQSYLMQRVGQHSMYDLRRQLFAHVQRLPVAFFDRNPVGRLVTRITNDVETLNDTIANALVALVDDVFVLTMIATVMLCFNWKLALISLAVVPGMGVATSWFRRAVRASYRRIRAAVARINTFLQEHVTGMAVVQASNRETLAYEEFTRINRQHCDAWTDAVFAYAVYYPIIQFLGTLAIALTLWFGGRRVLGGELTLGVVFAFIQYAQRFFRPIQDLSDRINTLQTSMAGSERVFRLLDTPVSETWDRAGLPAAPARPVIEFDHVWFAYQGDNWILRDLSFRIDPGDTLAIVGHTGAGKTTIISLLLRFYDVQRGAIRLDGVDIRELDIHSLRRRLAIVLQDPYLFSGSIADNIRMDDPAVPAARVQQAERDASLEEFLATLPAGDATELRERGSGLSTGQKQLVSFARALAADAPIIILDEATASVDTGTELRLRAALDRMLSGRTSIIIAHRLSTIQRATRILVLHKGTLREQGTHQELLRQRGIYWRLYRLQYKDQELGEVTAAGGQISPECARP